MRPSVGSYTPVNKLNTVVLPAPLGPISPYSAPCGTRIDSDLTAVSPPKRLVTSRTSRSGVAGAASVIGVAASQRRSPIHGTFGRVCPPIGAIGQCNRNLGPARPAQPVPAHLAPTEQALR